MMFAILLLLAQSVSSDFKPHITSWYTSEPTGDCAVGVYASIIQPYSPPGSAPLWVPVYDCPSGKWRYIGQITKDGFEQNPNVNLKLEKDKPCPEGQSFTAPAQCVMVWNDTGECIEWVHDGTRVVVSSNEQLTQQIARLVDRVKKLEAAARRVEKKEAATSTSTDDPNWWKSFDLVQRDSRWTSIVETMRQDNGLTDCTLTLTGKRKEPK